MTVHKQFPFILLLSCILLADCMPLWVHDYYSPTAAGGTVKKSYCGGSSGPPGTIEFVRNDVIIGIQADETKDGVSISVEMQIPEGRYVRFEHGAIYVYVASPSGTGRFTGYLSPIALQTMIGKTFKYKVIFRSDYHYNYQRFTMNAKLTIPKSEVIKVKLPNLFVNDERAELPEITFSKDKALELFMPMNC